MGAGSSSWRRWPSTLWWKMRWQPQAAQSWPPTRRDRVTAGAEPGRGRPYWSSPPDAFPCRSFSPPDPAPAGSEIESRERESRHSRHSIPPPRPQPQPVPHREW
ncbi:hypothetical protein PVAP13_3NG246400 [Panicum virgatum]|uniref:Uncharacterized protein n=1 Tax=Panicum virgatum TaxID=38727 RepID=A0A8T0UL71_PANVG|nr:hypothetical protein PVAP13_3NG246400 [Panicum virgatum]